MPYIGKFKGLHYKSLTPPTFSCNMPITKPQIGTGATISFTVMHSLPQESLKLFLTEGKLEEKLFLSLPIFFFFENVLRMA